MSYSKKLNQLLKRHKITPKKRVVFLLGAGAARIWADAPSSNDILNKLLNDSYYKTTDGITSIPRYIHEKLQTRFTYGVNFETIIAFLEEVLNFSLCDPNQASDPTFDSISPLIFQFKGTIDNLRDYRLIASNIIGYMGEQVNKYYSPQDTNNTQDVSEEIIDQVCFRNMLRRYLGLIAGSIENYDSCNSEVEEVNEKLASFLSYLKTNNFTPRFYTTNYDRKLPNLFKDLNIFDGFSDTYPTTYEQFYPADLKRIIMDRNCLNYYNLHGSIYWHEKISRQSFTYDYFCNPYQCNKFEFVDTQVQTNPGENLLNSGIITGYNKSQRITISPINHLFNSFYTDLAHADSIVIIGYSMSDPHLNRAIYNSIACGNPKVFYIDMFNGESLPEKTSSKLSQEIFGLHNYKLLNTIRVNDWFLSSDKSQGVFKGGFTGFLENDMNWRII